MTHSASRPAHHRLDALALPGAQRGNPRRSLASASMSGVLPTLDGHPARLADQRKNLPDGPGVYLFRDTRGKVIYVGKAKSIKKRVASHFSNPVVRGDVEMRRPHRRHPVRARRLRGRGAAGRAELHQAVPAALQHPPARRQVLSVHRHLDGRALPARLLHAREAPPQPRCTSARTRTPRRRAARSTCSARSSSSARARARSRAGARARRASTTTSSAAGRPASATSTATSTWRRSTASSRSCRAATGRSSATSSGACASRRRGAGVRDTRRSSATASAPCASLLERQRVANASIGTLDAVAVAVNGTDANAQVFQVRDGVLSDRQSFYLATRPSGRWATSSRSSSCSTTPTRCRSRRRSSSSASSASGTSWPRRCR